ncbi:MAG: caspase family protein [Planctomycetaceae bacterium]
MSRLPITALVTFGLITSSLATAGRADDAPRKVALLVGVDQYLKPNFKALAFAEADVTAVAEELKKLGFEVTLLLGSGKGTQQATLANIEAAAMKMVAPLGQSDVALVMLSGHGQQLTPTEDFDPKQINFDKTQSYYCPVDAVVNHPETQFSLSHLVDDILAPNVGRKLLLVDACRDIPVDRTRGRNAKGIEGRVVSLPEGTGVFFSCSAGQTSYERDELKHGLFTYCVLEGLRGKAVVEGVVEWDCLVAHVNRRMHQEDIRQYMPPRQPQVPIRAGSLPDTVLGKLDVRPEMTIPMPRPTVPANPRPTPNLPATGNLEGKQAGEVRPFTDLGVKFCWCPSGSFTMGSPASEADRSSVEAQVSVTLSRGFWLGRTEVTQGVVAECDGDDAVVRANVREGGSHIPCDLRELGGCERVLPEADGE